MCAGCIALLIGWQFRQSTVGELGSQSRDATEVDFSMINSTLEHPITKVLTDRRATSAEISELPQASDQKLPHARPPKDALNVNTYCELTLAKLELTHRCWQMNSRGPTPIEEGGLFARYGTTSTSYYAFGSANSQKLVSYLSSSAISDRIQELSSRIHELIEQKEVR
jgi:hypothetical protein